MKKSELLEHIKEETLEWVNKRKYSNETDDAYWTRFSDTLLGILLGFDVVKLPEDNN